MLEKARSSSQRRYTPISNVGAIRRPANQFDWLRLVRSVLATAAAWSFLSDNGQVHAVEAPTKFKNVLMIVSDDLKASALGCYGNRVCQTPHIDQLARRGMVFRHAYCQGTVCGPSRQSFMFSRYKGLGKVNVAQQFKESGWYSARVGKIYHMKVPGDIIAGTNGKDVPESWTERFNSQGQEAHTAGDYACLNLNIFSDAPENRQSTAMPHRMFVTVQYDGDGADQPDHKSATKAIELLRQHEDDPFFLAVGFVRPHYPMVAPRKYFDAYPWSDAELPESYPKDLEDIPRQGQPGIVSERHGIGKFPDNQKRMWSGYYASVTFMDEQVGRIIDELDRLGLRDSTAIVFLSDHGYHLGEHQFWQKGNLHEEVIRVPLIFSAPGFEPGVSDSIVELVDMFPTLCDLAKVDVPQGVQGTSLVPVLKDPAVEVKPGAKSFARGTSWRTSRWAYMRYNDRTEELYDMKADPMQFKNLASDPNYARVRAELASKIEG
jgi:iduronate 2-sulfatase